MATPLDGLRGESRQIAALRTQVAQLLARQTNARRLPPVLILGETGTGKGLLARSIHQAGPRHDGAFVGVNCAAIPETLLEAELFGYERGAFTDARHAKPGLFQTAQGGTLFLDEIGLLPSALQAKLLTVLEDRAVRRLGSTRTEPVDLALVAATSVELKRAVADGRFREDLYHRLAVISLEMPPLRDRGADILALADHFLVGACADYGLSPRELSPEARRILIGHRWPGNVRELSNAMERVALLSDTDAITAASLDFLTDDGARIGDASAAVAGSLDDTLRARIETALREHGGNIRRTAAGLGVSRNTLRARMDKYGLRNQGSASSRAARGARIAPARGNHGAPTHWERRHLALLRARLLPASAVDVARALEMIGEKVRTFGGRIEESSPTGAIAVFGLEPVDNAPSHAALAALAIQHATARARTVDSGGADVVTAIHCADHLVSGHDSPPLIGIDGKVATWSILETLVAADVPGAIFISDQVVPFLVRRFALGRVHEDPRTWRVLRREEMSAGWNATRFVGRTAELSALRHAASLAEQRHGQIVGIVGEAGVGKSRLVHEVVRPLQGWLLLSSGGASYMTNTSYFPLVELLKKLCHIQDTDAASEVRERVARVLRADADSHSVLPPILDLLGVLPLDDAFRDADPVQRRKRTHDAVREVFLTASLAQPLCLIIEDLHWIDSETQEVLDRLVNSLTASRVLLLINYRPEYQHPWGNKSYYTQLRLDALPPESASELLLVLLGTDATVEPLKPVLIARTSGNPLFLEESVWALVETLVLTGQRGAHRLARPLETIDVPATVQAILASRIDRLAPEDKQVLQTASVIGKDAPFALLLAVAELTEEDLRLGLARLQAAEFLCETSLFPEPEYTFKHALTHEVAYGSLLHERRRGLHSRIVDAIETLYAERLGEHVERLGHHALRGEVWEKAVRYLRQAGAKALGQSANREAATWFEQALSALQHLPDTVHTRAATIDLRVDLRTPLYALGELERLFDNLQTAERLAGELGDQRRLGLVSCYLAEHFRLVGSRDRAVAAGNRALSIAEIVEDFSLRVMANFYLGLVWINFGDYRRAAAHFTWVVDSITEDLVQERFGLAGLAAVLARAWLAWCLAECGEFSEAATRGEQAVGIAEASGQLWSLTAAHFGIGGVYLRMGDLERAVPLLERGVRICESGDVPLWFHIIAPCLGYALALSGRLDAALPILEQAVEQAGPIRVSARYALALSWLSEAYLMTERTEEAVALATRALDLSQQYNERGHEAWIRRLMAEIAARRGRVDEAIDQYTHAVTIAEELAMRPLVAHCHLGLGRVYRRVGRRTSAEEHFSRSCSMFAAMGMTSWSD